MMRTAGALMLLIGCFLVGFGAANGLKLRVQELDMMIESLSVMEREMKARLSPLPELLRLASDSTKGAVKDFYLRCEKSVNDENAGSFQAIWSNAAEGVNLRVSEQELGFWMELGAVLGRYDAGSQCKAIGDTREKLLRSREDAKVKREQTGTVYVTLGIVSGAIVSIALW